jgi:hypothetical protein
VSQHQHKMDTIGVEGNCEGQLDVFGNSAVTLVDIHTQNAELLRLLDRFGVHRLDMHKSSASAHFGPNWDTVVLGRTCTTAQRVKILDKICTRLLFVKQLLERRFRMLHSHFPESYRYTFFLVMFPFD